MSTTIHNIKGVEIKIGVSTADIDPREGDCLSKMVLLHNRWRIGDPHNYKQEDYKSWDELARGILRDNPNAVILPVYMYDHSGLAFSTGPFSCPWDSGQVGFIFFPLKDYREAHGIKRVSKKMRKEMEETLTQVVQDYSDELNQTYYYFKIEDEPSVHGFTSEEDALESAKIEIGA